MLSIKTLARGRLATGKGYVSIGSSLDIGGDSINVVDGVARLGV